MKKVLISAIFVISGLSNVFAYPTLNSSISIIIGEKTPYDNTDKIAIISETGKEQSNTIISGKSKVMIEEIENDDLGLENSSTMKEIEVSSTKFVDDSFIYVKERKDLIGYALQLASFSDLTLAKDFALKIARKGEAEKRQLFIYTVNSSEKAYYKVYFGLLKSDESAREKQRVFLSLGYSPFVKEFR